MGYRLDTMVDFILKLIEIERSFQKKYISNTSIIEADDVKLFKIVYLFWLDLYKLIVSQLQLTPIIDYSFSCI